MTFLQSKDKTRNNAANCRSIRRLALTCALAGLALLGGCAVDTSSKTVVPASAAEDHARVAAQAALNDGIGLYNECDYQGAVKQLGSASEIWAADKATQTEALKYMAFSYCV